MKKIICAGGGGSEDSRPVDEIFAAWLGSDARLLYWPLAMDGSGPTYPQCLEWITATLNPLGIERITMWTELQTHRPGELADFDGLYIGGGNTYRLLRQIKEAGWMEPLSAFVLDGHPTYGGSAGALILGKHMGTTHDENDAPDHPLDQSGADLLQGHAAWCHYQSAEDAAIKRYVARHGIPVLACSERSGLVVEGDSIRAGGFEGVSRFTAEKKVHFEPGAKISAARAIEMGR